MLKNVLSVLNLCLLGDWIDYDVEVGCCVEEKRVGGGLRYWRVNVGKLRESGLNLKGLDELLMCCLG